MPADVRNLRGNKKLSISSRFEEAITER